MKTINIVLAGVGGQGVILAMQILADAAVNSKLDVRASEIHGMAQRGGSVITHLRMGKKVYSPQVAEASADVIISFEPSETLRVLHLANSKTRIIMNTNPVVPTTVSIGVSDYPSMKQILHGCRKFSNHVMKIDALRLAVEAGSPMVVNTVLLGALAATGILPIKLNVLKKSLSSLISNRYRNMNFAAFDNGYSAISK